MKTFTGPSLTCSLSMAALLLLSSAAGAQTARDVDAINSNAVAFFDRGDPRAFAEFERAVELARKVYGANHVKVQVYRGNLAQAYAQDSQYDKAAALFGDMITKLDVAYQADRSGVANLYGTVLLNVGAFYGNLGQYARAIQWTQVALVVFDKDGWNGPASMARFNLGNLHGSMGEYDKALENFNACLRFRRKEFGDNDSRTADVLSAIGGVHAARKQFVEAERLYRRRLEVREAHVGPRPRRIRTGLPWRRAAGAGALQGSRRPLRAAAKEAGPALAARALPSRLQPSAPGEHRRLPRALGRSTRPDGPQPQGAALGVYPRRRRTVGV